MSTLLSIPDAAELLAHTITALKAAGYASAAMIPVHKNASNQSEQQEAQPATAPEVYVAPGKQYANVHEALAHMIHQLKTRSAIATTKHWILPTPALPRCSMRCATRFISMA